MTEKDVAKGDERITDGRIACEVQTSSCDGCTQGDDHSYNGSHGYDHDIEAHNHAHSYGNMNRVKWLLGLSVLLYTATFTVDDFLPEGVLIGVCLLATLLSGYRTFMRGLRNLFRLRFHMDTLMTVALTGATAIGEWREATLVAILFGLNDILEGYGIERARQSMETLLAIAPRQATLWYKGQMCTVPIERLVPGDIVIVRPGEKIPSDGTVVEGSSTVDEAAITGESLPVWKSTDNMVFGGSVTMDGVLKIRINKTYGDSFLAQILNFVKEVQRLKTPTELFINRFAKVYTPIVMVIAALVMFVFPLFSDGDWHKWLYQGLAVLIIGCPCALVLSSPIALVNGITRNARNGILIKGGVHLEQLGKIEVFAFDKTGTLTKGEPQVQEEEIYDVDRFYHIAGSIEQTSLHPLAKAILRHLKAKGVISFEQPAYSETVPGEGIRAQIGDTIYRVSSERVLDKLQGDPNGPSGFEVRVQQIKHAAERMKSRHLTVVVVICEQNGEPLGIFGLTDEVREESKRTIAALHAAGVKCTVMLTGDHAQSAEQVAKRVGVTNWYAQLLPQQKADKIKEIGWKHPVAMIGDGVNDAPALASAHLGIAMGKGTDSAMETADIVLMHNHLSKIPEAIRISRQVNRIVRWNIGLALGLKIIALLLTIPGRLTLWVAILSDMGATIIVTLLSMTVLLRRDRRA